MRRGSTRSSTRKGSTRTAAVDVVRGLLLAISVVTSSLIAPPDWFEHAPWASVHPLDVVFPAFVVLTGAGLGFAHRRGVRVSRLVRRVVVLIAAGMAYNAAMAWARDGTVDLDTLRWTGVLQLYAALVLVIAVLHLVVRGWIAWTGVALALAGAHTALLARWAVGCPGGEVTPQCNPSLSIDSAVLPTAHLYEQFSLGHDPEGLVALLGACATAAAGTAAAHAITASRASHAAALGRLLTVAVVVAAGAAAAAPLVPAMKRLWTAPFGLGVAAAVVLVVAVVHAVVDAPWVDAPGIERGAGAGALVRSARRPFVALGRNSLLVYFGSHVVAELLLLRPLRPDPTAAPSYAESLGQGLGWLVSDQVGFSAAVLACWWVLATALHRRGWYLRA